MKLIHDLLPCGVCLVFYVKIVEVNGLYLCRECITRMKGMIDETTE